MEKNPRKAFFAAVTDAEHQFLKNVAKFRGQTMKGFIRKAVVTELKIGAERDPEFKAYIEELRNDSDILL